MKRKRCMYTLIFDTETTGLPLRYGHKFAPPTDTYSYDNARLIEIAYIIVNDEKNIIKKVNHLVKYDDIINITNYNIHGIDNMMVEKSGKTIDYVFNEFATDLKDVNTLVAHNINFDINILLSECYREHDKYKDLINEIKYKNKYCTMLEGKKHMKKSKWPKLKELHEFIFNTEWVQSHRALDDTETCMKCYFSMT